MQGFQSLSEEELNKLDKSVLIMIIGSLQEQLTSINNQLNVLTEQIALMNQRSYGRKTEQLEEIHQLTMYDVFNEAEVLYDGSPEPEITEINVSGHTRKKKTKREDKLEGLPARIINHRLSKEELSALFPEGYKELPPVTYKRLSVIPQTFIVDEHHVHVYASKNNDGRIVKAKRPKDVFRNSTATVSLISAFITGKYLNHLPIERQVKCFNDNGADLESNTVAGWMINSVNYYFQELYDELHRRLCTRKVIHADETPFRVIQDGRPAGSKSYMWVYRNGACDQKHPIILFDHQSTRRLDHPDEFLKDFSGVLVTDGYQVYHSLSKKRDGLKVAGCWIHAKRKFAELVKAVGDSGGDTIVAKEATRRISHIFHLDNQLDDLPKVKREKERQRVVKPEVDDFFAWAKEAMLTVPPEGDTYKGLQYCINQEQYLRVFLSNGNVPMDNNPAEQAIRPFTVGRKNWVNIYSENGASSSAVLYSIVETAKANDLRINDYLNFVLTELVNHSDDTDRSFLYDLLPWSREAKKKCARLQKA